MNKAILLKSDDWEGLYVNDLLIDEGHELNEGEERAIYFAQLAKQYNFNLLEMKIKYLSNEDTERTNDIGSFPDNITDFKHNYA